MCGIAAALSATENAHSLMMNSLLKLNHRGYDSWGYAYTCPRTQKIIRYRELGPIYPVEFYDDSCPKTAIGHTRWATHGKVSLKNTHPVGNGVSPSCYVVHNGIIDNYENLKKSLKLEGAVFETETDTEVIAHLIVRFGFRAAMDQLEGNFAIATLTDFRPDCLALYTRGSNLFIGRQKDSWVVASEEQALSTDTIARLPDYHAVFIDNEDVALYNKHWEPIPLTTLDWKKAGKLSPPSNSSMLDEIREQVNLGDLSQYASKLPQYMDYCDIHLVGCGSSYHAALVAEKWGRRLGLEYKAVYATEIDGVNNFFPFILLSQSGETKDTLEALKEIKEKECKTLCLTSSHSSSIARLSDYSMELPTGKENGVAATKTFTAQLAYLYHLIHEDALKLPKEALCICKRDYSHEAEKLSKFNHVLFLGRGLLYPIALEAALKLKEVSYIHAEGLHAGEIKHGPIALIDEKTICLFLLGKNKPESVLANIEQVKARGGKVWVAVCYSLFSLRLPCWWAEVDEVFLVPEVPEELEVFPFVIWAQLIAYYTAVAKGLNPERPRSLAKVITV